MNKKAVAVTVGTFVCLAIASFLIACTVMFWQNRDKQQESYDKGFEAGSSGKDAVSKSLSECQIELSKARSDIVILNNKILELVKDGEEYQAKVTSLTAQKVDLETQVSNLTTIQQANESTISSLNSQINLVKEEVRVLTESGEAKDSEILQKNVQISNLQSLVEQLQTTNEQNVKIISNLNKQILDLNTQIAQISDASNDSQNKIASLNAKISELQKSVSYYENYIASLENGEQVVATFEYDGSVYNIQIVNKNTEFSVVDPTSTTYKVFNGWKNSTGQAVTFPTKITENTKFIADVTYKYDVKFVVDEVEYISQVITKNSCATLPSAPTKTGYEFLGWSTNGTDIVENIAEKPVTANTSYTAVWAKLHTVTFMYDGEVLTTQKVKNGSYPTEVTLPESTKYKVFNGWLLNNSQIDVTTYKITTETTFVASITYKYDVIFYNGSDAISTQLIEKDECAVLPSEPTKEGYEFLGWSINGTDVVENIAEKPVTANINYTAMWIKLHTVTFMVDDEVFTTCVVRDGECMKVGDVPREINDTKYKVFGGWLTLDKYAYDWYSYEVRSDMTLVASFAYYYDVKFMVDDEVYSSTLVRKGLCSFIPNNPTKENYEFNGWVVSGTTEVVDLSTYPITSHTTFVAKFTQIASWQTLENSGFTCNSSSSTVTIDVSGLLATDTFRVNISELSAEDNIDSGCSSWFYTDKGYISTSGNKASLVVNGGEMKTIDNLLTSGSYVTILFSCSEDGKLTITKSGNYAKDYEIFIDHFIVTSIEVFR